MSLVDSDGVILGANTIVDAEIGITMQAQGSFFSDPMCFPPLVPPQNSGIFSNVILDATEAGAQSAAFTATPANNPILGMVPQLNSFLDNFIMSAPEIEFAPIAVSSGQNNRFIENLIFTGPTSGIVDQGFNNLFANFCSPDNSHGCNPLTSARLLKSHDQNALLPPPGPHMAISSRPLRPMSTPIWIGMATSTSMM